MPEEELFYSENSMSRAEIAELLADTAEAVESGTISLSDVGMPVEVSIPTTATFEIEVERMTSSETGDQHYQLEYEIAWDQSPDDS